MAKPNKTRVAVNGFGVIGRRVADAVSLQEDMELVGVADVATDWRIRVAEQRQYRLFAFNGEARKGMEEAGLRVQGLLRDLLAETDVVVDCAPKRIGAENAALYRELGLKFIVQGGEKHEVTNHSFVAEVSYEQALGRNCTRVVSCNTTSIVRTLGALKNKGLLRKARGTLLRRATDPMDSHRDGIMNTVVPETKIPSHQGPDAQTVIPDLDVVTMAVKIPETLGHVHFWNVELTREASAGEIVEALSASSRIALVEAKSGLGAINSLKELMSDLGRPRQNMYEVALWRDILSVQKNEAFFAYMVDNQAIVIPETIDAIRALTGHIRSASESIQMTNQALGISRSLAI